jgi:hypothetical protein
VGFGRVAAGSVGHEEHVVAVLTGAEHRERQAHLGPQSGNDDLPPPVRRTASRNAGSSHALIQVRSMIGWSGKTSVTGAGMLPTVSCATVLSTTGTPNSLAVFARATVLLRTICRSCDCTPKNV